MELGIVQKAWISDMRRFPRRQLAGSLGYKNVDGAIRACCLGQGILTLCEHKGVEPFYNGDKFLCDTSQYYNNYPNVSYVELGLRDNHGKFLEEVASNYFGSRVRERKYLSLSQMNDGGIPWAEIANYMEDHPENVFIESK